MAHINLTQVRAFVAVVDAGSFSGAAARLNLTQSAVSHALRQLETTLGVPLMHRSRSGVSLTQAGEMALREARAAVAAIEALLRSGDADVSGTVTIASVVSASILLLPRMIGTAQRRHPGLDLRVLVGTDAEVAAWTRDGIADIGLTYDPRPGAGVPLIADEFVAISAPTTDPGTTLRELAAAPFVMSGSGCGPLVRELFDEAGLEPRVVTTVSDVNALLALVGAGLGVSVVPRQTLDLPAAPRLTVRQLSPSAMRPLQLVTAAPALSRPAATIAGILMTAAPAAATSPEAERPALRRTDDEEARPRRNRTLARPVQV